MAAGVQVTGLSGPSRRRVPRFRVQAPVDVTVLRSGIPETVPGRSVNVCERGIAAVIAAELMPGESVGVEVQLSPAAEPLCTKATVRYQDELRCGLEFVAISAEQRSAIRVWAKEARAETVTGTSWKVAAGRGETKSDEEKQKSSADAGRQLRGFKRKGGSPGWLIAGVLTAILAAALWWKWNRGWEQLESGLNSSQTSLAEKPQVQVPAEVMQKLLVHRVEPVYPAEARRQNLRGIIALDIVVGRDGSVLNMRALNGPEVLARAAMDALRWWRFEPYRVNGEAVVVETTVAVEFKP